MPRPRTKTRQAAAAQRQVPTLTNVVSAMRRGDEIYLIMLAYRETDALNAGALVLRSSVAREGRFQTLMRTNDALCSVWVSAQEHIWAVSSRGNVWTSAATAWPELESDWLDYVIEVDSHTWQAAALGPRQAGGAVPAAQLVWGTSDQDIHVPCFGGSIYHWNGAGWREWSTALPPRTGFNGIHGSGPDNIYVVGDRGCVLRFDGSNWTQVPIEGAQPSEAYTGVRVLDADNVIVCGRSGSLLRGNTHGLALVQRCNTSLYGISKADGRIILSGGDSGAWELIDDRLEPLLRKPLVGGFDGGDDMALFVQPTQEEPSLISFTPSAQPAWLRRTFNRPGATGQPSESR